MIWDIYYSKGGWFFIVAILLCIPHNAWGAEESGKKNLPDVQLNPMGISSSAECGKCHKDIYSTWKNSLHAQSVNNPVFWAAFIQAYYQSEESAKQKCLLCHAPIVQWNQDHKLFQPITREGISCDYCHSITKISAGKKPSGYQHEFGLVKQGPLKNVVSPVHETRFNEFYKESRYCSGCHEYESENGLKLIETYSEWKQSSYPAKGIHCQNCHMRKVPGKIVAEEILKIPDREISSHDIAGGHSLTMRENSLDIRIKTIQRYKQKLLVTVNLTNKGAGHKIPTGLPSKKIILEVAVLTPDGQVNQASQRIYQKVVVDDQGLLLRNDTDTLLGKGERILSDNRIGPLETRREEFTFFVPETEAGKVTATVFYSHNPQVIQEAPIHMKMNEVSEWVGR